MDLSTITMLAFQLGLLNLILIYAMTTDTVLIDFLCNHCQLYPQYCHTLEIFREKHASFQLAFLHILSYDLYEGFQKLNTLFY